MLSTLLLYIFSSLALATVLFIAWLVFQAIASQSFFDWIGDRIDNFTDDQNGFGLSP